MSFAKSSVLGFTTGFAVALVTARIRVPVPAFLISADKKERLSKKEAAAKINDALEDRELLFRIFLASDEEIPHLIPRIRLKALIDPAWDDLIEKLSR